MATRFLYLSRSVFTSKQALTSFLSRSYTVSSTSLAVSQFSAVRLRPLFAVAHLLHGASPASLGGFRAFSTRHTQSSLNDSSPNWSNRPPKETILLDGCDFEHWLVVVEKPDENMTRDQIIDMYIKTLAQVVGSEEEARMKIYSVSTKHYFAFGALVPEEMSYKIKELPKVRWVLPDSYLDVKNQDYGGEPFINGEAVPYDPKYHDEWVRNNAKAMERNRRNDRPRNFDRSRNFERRRQNMQNPGPPMPSAPPGGMPPNNMGGGGMPPNNMGGGGMPPNNMGGGGMPPNNMGGGGMPPNNMGGGGMPPNNMGGGGMPPNNMGGGRMPPNNMGGGGMPPNNMGGGGMPPNNMGGGAPPPNMGGYSGGMRPNMGPPQGPPQGAPNSGWQGNTQNFQGGGYPQNPQGPPPPSYQNVGPNNNFRGPPGGNQGYPQNPQGPPPPPPNYPNFAPPSPGNQYRGPPGENQYQGQDMPPPPPSPPRNY